MVNAEKGDRSWGRIIHRAEDIAISFFLVAMPLLAAAELITRWCGVVLPGASEYLQHLTLWLAFCGAGLASRSDQHLRISVLERFDAPRFQLIAKSMVSVLTAAVCLLLAGASIQLIVSEAPALPEAARSFLPGFLIGWLEPYGLFEAGSLTRVGGWLPVWAAELVMPLLFAIMAVRSILRAGSMRARWIVLGVTFLIVVPAPYLLSGISHFILWPAVAVFVVAAVLGLPIFALLGGLALLLFWSAGETTAAIPAETYRIVTSTFFPTIPIFTLAGFILSESQADQRLVRVFRACFGWIPGGSAVAATVLCAFFTTFTGASGVTILALGGLLLPVLIKDGFSDRFSIGLLTSTGSLGLLLPPSLVVILYAVVAHVPVTDMFLAGMVPGMLLVVAIGIYCMASGVRAGVVRTRFEPGEMVRALWAAKWEVAIPVLALTVIFGGFCTLVQAAAIIVIYAFFVEVVIYRDLPLKKVLGVFTQCATLVGGVLIILAVAMGLTSYLVDAQIPDAAADWARAHIEAKWVFLLLLNVALILVGCVMDIFSALVVVVPILLPMAEAFGVHPAHLGVIFLANLQLGYLTPPVGMNLFLSSFRFNRPLPEVYRAAVPFLLILAAMVLLITFVPALTMWLLE